MDRKPFQQADSPQGRAQNEMQQNAAQARFIVDQASATTRGAFPVADDWGDFGADDAPMDFDQSCDGTNILVNPGVWSIFAIGSASGGGTLALGSASETWVCLRRPVDSLGAELCKVDGSTRPAANDSSFYYLVLCHCVKTGGIWTIAQRCWRGDFYESAPVINA